MSLFRTTLTLCSTLLVFLGGKLSANDIPYFTLITVPKSGSHLMIKTLYFLIQSPAVWHTKFPSYQYIPAEDGFLYTHFCVPPELEADYNELPELKKIILIRDFRDAALSIVSQIKKTDWPGLTPEERAQFLKMPFEDQLLFVINFEYDVREVAKDAPNSLQVSLAKLAKQAAEYSKQPGVMTFRYEDLVGPSGGGSSAAQIEQLRRLQQFLNIDIDEATLEEVARQIYGDDINPFGAGQFQNYASTFNIGVIGRWKECFNEQHKLAFKAKLGDTLVQLGYEKDLDW